MARGFTLIEILLVILIFMLMATIALTNLSQTTEIFDFFVYQKQLVTDLREVRGFAASSKQFSIDCPERADSFLKDFYAIELQEDGYSLLEGGCVDKEIDLSETDYRISLKGSGDLGDTLKFPVHLAYEKGSGEFFAYENDGIILDKSLHQFVAINMSDEVNNVDKEIVIFQISGLPETFNNLNLID